MNYSEKRTLAGRIVYITLTLMAVTILCVTLYTFFGSSRRGGKTPVDTNPKTTESSKKGNAPVTDEKPVGGDTEEPVGNDTDDDKPTDVTPVKDWTKLKVMMPVEGVVAKKHDLEKAVFSLTMNDYRVHQGIDIEGNDGDDVLSCAYGTVKTVGNDPFMGCTVIIDHGNGLISYYKNLSTTLAEGIKEGVTVFAGQKIGSIGESAIIEISDNPHVHFELELNGKQIDPLTMLNYDEAAAVEDAANQDK